jgi:inner membrane protein
MAAGRAYVGKGARWGKAAFLFSVISLWPDFDAIGFAFGIDYEDQFGHRGATHSTIVALCVGLISYLLAKRWDLPAMRTFVITTLVAMSHGILDTMTFGGGLGCALLWPLSAERFWAPLRFIPVAPIGLHMFSRRGAYVVASELILFSPFWLYAIWPRRNAAVTKQG